jgi:hypothetical protein
LEHQPEQDILRAMDGASTATTTRAEPASICWSFAQWPGSARAVASRPLERLAKGAVNEMGGRDSYRQ